MGEMLLGHPLVLEIGSYAEIHLVFVLIVIEAERVHFSEFLSFYNRIIVAWPLLTILVVRAAEDSAYLVPVAVEILL